MADQWAWSPQGIRYALRQMQKAGASGLTGNAAIEKIIREFERPADPDSSVRNAIARYGSIQTMFDQPQMPNPRRRSVATQALTGQPQQPRGPSPRHQLAQQILAGIGDPTFSYIEALNDFQLATIEQQARETRGTVLPPQRWRRNGPPRSGSRDPVVDKVLNAAQAQLGKPYVWGGETPQEGFDCSGLIAWAYQQAGRPLPGGRPTTWTMMKMGRSVKGKKYRPGDMIITNGGKHVVMYVGGNRVIAAPYTGAVVRYQPLSDFAGDIVDVRRVI